MLMKQDMDNPLNKLSEINKDYILRISELSYEEIESLFEIRDSLISMLPAYFEQYSITEEDKKCIESIMKDDLLFASRIEELKRDAADWLAHRNAAKSQKNAYELQYASNGILMDKRE